MAKRKPKATGDDEDVASGGLPASEGSAEPPPISDQVDAPGEPTADAAEGGEKRQWTSTLPDPHGHHGTLVSAEGHRVRQLLGRQFNQQKIMFTAPEGKDPKPDRKYIEMMHDMGWKWRASDKMWEKQLLSPDERDEVKELREAGDKLGADQLRSKYSDPRWLDAQRDYHKLVETMRADAGMEPSVLITDNLKFLDRAR